MSEHHDAPKAHEPHALHQDHPTKGPHDPKEINPKMSSDIAYWSKELGVTPCDASTAPTQPSAPTAPTSIKSAPPSAATDKPELAAQTTGQFPAL